MIRLQISPGDIIEIEGKRKTVAKVWRAPKRDWGRDIIRIRVYGMDVGDYLKHQLLKRPVIEGDLIPIIGAPALAGFGKYGQNQALLFVAVKTEPKGVVIIDETTRVIYRDRPAKGFERLGRGGVTYEDIGGLKAELQKVREIIELPLRYPELFQRG